MQPSIQNLIRNERRQRDNQEGAAAIGGVLPCRRREASSIPYYIRIQNKLRRNVTTKSNLNQKIGDASRASPFRESLLMLLGK